MPESEAVGEESKALVVVRVTNEIVTELKTVGGKVMCSSLDVARRFGKRHDNVIRDIRNMVKACQEAEIGLLNFEEALYTHPQNGQTYDCFLMDRYAFTMLVRSFTGVEATRWNWLYVQAFNAMEAKLREPTPQFSGDPLVQQAQLFLSLAQRQVAAEERFTAFAQRMDEQWTDLTGRVENIEKVKVADSIPLPKNFIPADLPEAPDMTARSKVVMLVRRHARNTNQPVQDVWDNLYYQAKYGDSIDVKARTRGKNQSLLDLVKDGEEMNKLFARAVQMFSESFPRK